MKRLTLLATIALAYLGAPSHTTFAQSASASQQLRFEVRPVVSVAVSGNPGPMVIDGTLGGMEGRSARDQTTRYSLVSNVAQMRILASLNEPMPAGTFLKVELQSMRGTSAGEVDLSQSGTPKEVVSGIQQGCDNNLVIAYRFAAEPQVTEMKPFSRTIVLTLTN